MIVRDLVTELAEYPDYDIVFTSDGDESIYVGVENITVKENSGEIFIDVGDFVYEK